jgi:hypothetical protein
LTDYVYKKNPDQPETIQVDTGLCCHHPQPSVAGQHGENLNFPILSKQKVSKHATLHRQCRNVDSKLIGYTVGDTKSGKW